MAPDEPEPRAPAAPKRRRKKRGVLWNTMEYVSLVACSGLLRILPHSAASALGAAGGAFYGGLCRMLGMRDHRVATTNLKLAFPEKSDAERSSILKAMWRTWGRFAADGSQLLNISPESLQKLVTFDPPERFLEIKEKAKRRGALILTGHYGSFEMLHAAISAYGAPVTLVHRPMSNPLVDTWLRNLRKKFGTTVIDRGQAAREVLRELRKGKLVGIPFDQTARRTMRVFAPFFGVNASTNSGLARLALASGAPVYPGVLIRVGESTHHRVFIGPELELIKTGDRESDIIANTIRFNKVYEDMVRAHPDHWIWMYRRFKQQPEGMCSPYLRESPPIESYRIATVAG